MDKNAADFAAAGRQLFDYLCALGRDELTLDEYLAHRRAIQEDLHRRFGRTLKRLSIEKWREAFWFATQRDDIEPHPFANRAVIVPMSEEI